MRSLDNKTRRADSLATEQHDGLKMGNRSPIESDTTPDSTTHELRTIAAQLPHILRALESISDQLTDRDGCGIADVLYDLVTAIYNTES